MTINYCSCSQISTDDGTIEWCKEIRYLGIYILSGKHFKCNFDQARINFYRSVNSIFNKIGQCSSPRVILSLLSSYCLPALMYGMEVVPISTRDTLRLNLAYSRAFMKIFFTYIVLMLGSVNIFLVVYTLLI